jgi:hypothetical protein
MMLQAIKGRCQEIVEGKNPSMIEKMVKQIKQHRGEHPVGFRRDQMVEMHKTVRRQKTNESGLGPQFDPYRDTHTSKIEEYETDG